MGVRAAWARYWAARALKRGRPERSLRWYEQAGEPNLSPREKAAFAQMLAENGDAPRAIRLLSEAAPRLAEPDLYVRLALLCRRIGRERDAIAALDEAIRLNPAPYLAWYTRALAYSALGDDGRAAADMQEAAARDTGASSRYELGCIYLRMGRHDEAARALEQAVAAQESPIPLYIFRLAEAYEGEERYEQALAAVRRAAELQSRLDALPDKGEAYLRQRTRYSDEAIRALMAVADEEAGFRLKEAQLLERAGRAAEALRAVALGRQMYPEAEELLLRQGTLLRELGRHEEAIASLQEAKRRNPMRLAAYMELCATYRRLERWEEASGALKEALRVFPNQTVVQFWLVDVYRDAGMREQAWAASTELTKLEPDDPLNWKQRAELAVDRERYAEAEEAYTRALELGDNADYYMRRSYVRFMAGRHEEALLDVQAALRVNESLRHDGKTAFALAELYMGLGNRELAEAEYGRAIALDPGNPRLYERRANCRLERGRLAEALEDCRRGQELEPANARLDWMLSLIYWRNEEYDAALGSALDYARKAPEDDQGHYNLASIYSRMRRYDDAIRSLNRAIGQNPFEPRFYLERASIYYHRMFDRARAADDLAQWLLYAGAEKPEHERTLLIGELDGFDDEMRARALEQYLSGFGTSRYLS